MISSLVCYRPQLGLHLQGQGSEVYKTSVRRLGVQYVLEGSVRRADEQVRITAQLIDATHRTSICGPSAMIGHCKDIFALQDEIVQKIVFALKVKLTQKNKNGSSALPPTTWKPMIFSCADRRLIFAHCTRGRKRRMCRRGRCTRKPLSWTRSMPERMRG